jgi:hypothetical protein
MSGMAPHLDEMNPINVDDRDANIGVTPRSSNGVHVGTTKKSNQTPRELRLASPVLMDHALISTLQSS